MNEYLGDGPAGKLKLGALCAVLALACGGCVPDCSGTGGEGPTGRFDIGGPYVENADGSLTPVNSVAAGQPVVFVVDGFAFGFGSGSAPRCPDVLYWYMKGSSTAGPDLTVRPPKADISVDLCAVQDETITWTFPAGQPGPENIRISAQLLTKNGANAVGSKDVTVVTPDGAPTPPPPPPPGSLASFAPAQLVAAGLRPVAVAAANLKPPFADEVVVADDEPAPADRDRLFIFAADLATGTTLTGPQTQLLDAGDDPRDVVAADFDGDGDRDLAVANFQGGNGSANDEVQLLDNQGTTGAGDIIFGEDSIETAGGTDGVAVGDLNRDIDQSTGNPELHPDLVAVNRVSNNVSVAMNSGDPTPGGFEPAVSVPSGGMQPSDVATGDFNGDGLDDIAVVNTGSGNVHVLRNTGPPPGPPGPASTFAAPEHILTPDRPPEAVAVGDFNEDGLDDIAVASSGGFVDQISVLINTSANGATDLTFSESGLLPPFGDSAGTPPRDLAVGDFNGDRSDDLASANSTTNNASVFIGTGEGAFAAPIHLSMGQSSRSIAAGAMNGDRLDDLAVANFGASAPPATGGSLTVAFARQLRGRASAGSSAPRAPAPTGEKATNIKVAGAFSNDKVLSYGQSSFDEAGIGHLQNRLFSARLKAQAKPERKLPAGFTRRLVADVVARVDVDIYPEADLLPPTVARGLVVGRVKKDPATVVCLRVQMDSREGIERGTLKFLGAAGAVAGLRGNGTFAPPTLEDAANPSLPKWGNLGLAAKVGKERKLPRQCRALLKKLPTRAN